MRERTLKVLEYKKIINKVSEYVGSALGKAKLAELEPLTDPGLIREAQQVTTEAVRILAEGEPVPMGGVFDIRLSLKRVALNGILAVSEFLELGATMRASRLMKDFLDLELDGLEFLPEWGGRLGSFPALEREIERCFNFDGEVLDSASPKLHSIRSQIKTYQNRVREKLEGIIRSGENSKYLQELLVTMRNDRYVIPVKQEYRSLFPGIVHDQSGSGATLFIEPASVVELNNQLRICEAQEVEEIERILSELSGKIKGIADYLQISVEILARLDLAFAKARYSQMIHGVEPVFNREGIVNLYQARHPLLTGKVIPVSVALGKNYDTLVITGPNTGGKTVTLKTVGLLALMAQSGLHIPADSGSELPIFEEIFCDIGDEQSIEQSLSTFSSHLTNIVEILKDLRGADCLVLLDELGAGTDPTEGAALAMSILTYLHENQVRSIATTHYSELKAFAYQTPGIENAAVEFDIETLRPTYHLLTGLPGSSQAFEIAQKLGLPDFLVAEARVYISAEIAKVENMLQEIENDRKKARDDRLLSEAARAKGESYQKQYETELAKLRKEKADLVRQAKIEAEEILINARRESENLLRRLREAPQAEKAQIVNEGRQKIGVELTKIREELAEPKVRRQTAPEKLQLGAKVRSVSLNQTGTILELNGETALVQLGIMKVNLAITELELVTEEKVKVKRTPQKTGFTGFEAAEQITTEISLRGMTVDEALYELGKYLDQALLAGLNRFRVVHGKGTGVLRQAVWQYLKENSMIQSFQYAEQNEGGLGATVVELKRG